MKTKNVKVLFSAAIVLLMAWAFAACSSSKDNPTPVVVSKIALNAALDTANHYLSTTVEGNAAGDYTVGSRAPLQTVVTAATAVNASSTSTQSQIDATTANLLTAIVTYKAALILPVGQDKLIAYWKFDDGTGTTATDASANAHNGTLTAGIDAQGGGPVPNWVNDRFGSASKALHFTDGGHVEVPVSAAFQPSAITIALWVKLDSVVGNATNGKPRANVTNGIYRDNYLLAQDDYNIYKFQTQEAKKPFFTVASTTYSGTYINKDTDNGDPANHVPNSLKFGVWTHVAVVFNASSMTFYINGAQSFTWSDATFGAIKPLSPADLFVIGAGHSNAWFTANPATDYTPAHFYGALDEVRLYNSDLTGAQITSIYNQEKP